MKAHRGQNWSIETDEIDNNYNRERCLDCNEDTDDTPGQNHYVLTDRRGRLIGSGESLFSNQRRYRWIICDECFKKREEQALWDQASDASGT